MRHFYVAPVLLVFAWSTSAVTLFDSIYVNFIGNQGTGQPRSAEYGPLGSETTYNLFGSEPGDYDNYIASVLDEDGDATGVSMLLPDADAVTYVGPVGISSNSSGGTGTTATIFASEATSSVMWASSFQEALFTIGNLDSTGSTLYEIEIYSGRSTSGDKWVTYAVNGVDQGSINANPDNNSTVVISDLVPNASGVLNLTIRSNPNVDGPMDGNGFGYFNALRLTSAVPEPSSILLAGLGGLLMLKRRR